MDEAVKILERTDGRERVVICVRSDGLYTYCRQFADHAHDMEQPGWGALGPECGIYDNPLTAETEAMQRVDWLRATFQ